MLRRLPRLIQNFYVAYDVGDFERLDPGLSRPKDLALTSDLEILLGDSETVACLLHYPQPLFSDGRFLIAGEEDAKALLRASTDAAAELMKLRKSETLRMFDHH